jgi:hypothetical protein
MSLAPRLEILPPVQRQLWPSLRGLAAAGFVLYGGTAIALRCGHRVSVDFDFFTARPLERAALQRLLPWLKSSTVLQDQPGCRISQARSPCSVPGTLPVRAV